MTGVVHIIGAGLAGLSTAVRLLERGVSVRLYEAAPFAGGRCRTFHDPRLGRDVDNGNHLLLTGNSSAAAYLSAIGAADLVKVDEQSVFPFVDVAERLGWNVEISAGRLPWWIFSTKKRVPGTRPLQYISALHLAFAGQEQTVAEVIRERGHLWSRFWEPLTLAALNTVPEEASARLLWNVLDETFMKGGTFCRPIIAPKGLGTALVEPALAWIQSLGGDIRFGASLKALAFDDQKVVGLSFANGLSVDLPSRDRVVIALPPSRLKSILPWAHLPRDDASILNAHFLIDDPRLGQIAPITGLVNARPHWIFLRGDVLSLTISAADKTDLMKRDADELGRELWADTARALNLTNQPSAIRINKEHRATIDQSPTEVKKRPKARTQFTNLFLAGDATDTGLPATIEGAIRSGETAARLAA